MSTHCPSTRCHSSAASRHDHGAAFDGMSAGYRRALIWVLVLNGGMFVIEMLAGALAGSRALQADALDFLADSLTYGLSFWVLGKPLRWRSYAALAKGVSLLLIGGWVLGSTLWEAFTVHQPQPEVMGVIGLLALAANVASVLILLRYRDGDANVRSVWLCSRNDAIGNVAVLGAAGLVAWLGSGWPDLLVAGAMAGLFLHSATLILRQALRELRSGCSG